VEAIQEAAIAASGRVDLAVIAVDNAIAAAREAEMGAIEALRRYGDGSLPDAFRNLQKAMDASRGAWEDTVAVAEHADGLRRLAERAKAAWQRIEAAPAGQANGEAFAIAEAATEADRLLREVEAATLDLKRRWLLPLPNADAPTALIAEEKSDGKAASRP
jgi:hypothetical protein